MQIFNMIYKLFVYLVQLKNNVMSSWKTTLFGLIGAIGAFFLTQDFSGAELIGQILSGLSVFLLGSAARDNDVSSESAGAK